MRYQLIAHCSTVRGFNTDQGEAAFILVAFFDAFNHFTSYRLRVVGKGRSFVLQLLLPEAGWRRRQSSPGYCPTC